MQKSKILINLINFFKKGKSLTAEGASHLHTRTVKAHWSAIGRCSIYKSHIHFLGEHHIKDSNSAGAIFGQSPDGDDLLVNS